MLSNSYKQGMENWRDNVFKDISTAQNEGLYFRQYLDSHDFSIHTVKAMIFDIRKFALYFTSVNKEPFDCSRITVMDLTSFKGYLRGDRQQAVSTVNRCLVSIRSYMEWLVEQGKLDVNPGKVVKELRKQSIVPKGLERSQVRKLLREVDLRQDIRSKAIFSLF